METLPGRPPVVMLVAKAFQRPDIPRAKQEAKTLCEAGYPVYVLAWDRNAEYPRIQDVDGVVVRSFTPVNLTKFSKYGLAIGGILFQALLFLGTIQLITHLKKRPIVHAHDINTLPIGCFLRALGLCSHLIYDCREFTYWVYGEWFNPLVASIVRVVEEECLHYADAVITVCDSIATYLRKYNPVTEVIYNCPRMTDIPSLSKEQARMRLGIPIGAFVISSVGMIRYGCRFELMLAVAPLTMTKNVQYIVVGDGPLASGLRRTAEEADNPCIRVLPRVSREVALSYVLASDLTWAVYQSRTESMSERVSIPWKFCESLACGVPVIVEAPSIRAELVEEYGCGLVLRKDDPHVVSHAILRLATHPDEYHIMCARAQYASNKLGFDWETVSEKLINIYERLCKVRTDRGFSIKKQRGAYDEPASR